MEVQYVGANCRQGVSEKNGRPYTIAEVLYMIADEHSEKKSEDGNIIWRYTAFGNKVRSLPCDPSKLSAFEKCKPGDLVQVQLEPNPENPTRNFVVGLK